MERNDPRRDEDRDSVSPQPEDVDPADAGGDSPGPSFETPPDRPLASDRAGTTAEEQREPSLERRLSMERPDTWETGRAGEPRSTMRPIVDDDVPVEDLGVDDPGFVAEEADLDRTAQEAAEESTELVDEGPEGAAMHVEPE